MEKCLLRKSENTKKYQLGFSILELGLKQLTELDIHKQAALLLKKLSNNVNKICSLGIWNDNSVLMILRSDPDTSYAHGFSSVSPIRGKPAYCTSIGKAILSFMQKEAIEAYLKEKEYYLSNRDFLNNSGAQYGIIGAPREFAVQIKKNF